MGMDEREREILFASHVNEKKEHNPVRKTVRCPVCKQEVSFDGNPFRPFCSKGCKGLDLIHWARESYRIEGKPETEERNEDAD